MEKVVLVIMIFLFTGVNAQKSIHEFNFETLDGKTISFSTFKGKQILIVNTASKCGYTKQYKGLQELHKIMGSKVVIIGFPANNFGKQEPGTDDEIAEFCKLNYGVTFLMASKVSVKGEDIDPLFAWLTSQNKINLKGEIRWNFEKFLLDKNGVLTHRFKSKVKPLSVEITSKISE